MKCDDLTFTVDYDVAMLGKPNAEALLRLNRLVSYIKQASVLVRRVFDYYSGLVGQTVEIALRSGIENVLIERVDNDVISLIVSGERRLVSFVDLRLEQILEVALRENSAEAYDMVFAFCLASGKPETAQQLIRRAHNAGLNVDAWKDRIFSIIKYLQPAGERAEQAAQEEFAVANSSSAVPPIARRAGKIRATRTRKEDSPRWS